MKLFRGRCKLEQGHQGLRAIWCDSAEKAEELIASACRDGCVENIVEVTDIPAPDNPEHVGNMKSLSLLLGQGYRGCDASLAESLFEYGLVWILTQHAYVFIYRTGRGNKFSRATLAPDIDPRREWSWVGDEWDGFTLDDGSLPPLPTLVSDLVNWYGHINVFGEGGIEFEIHGR